MKAFTNFNSSRSLYNDKNLFNPMFIPDETNKSIDKMLNTSHNYITKVWNEGSSTLKRTKKIGVTVGKRDNYLNQMNVIKTAKSS